jgi:aspartyl-tRNA(Asn)/glutamyl-tRNA(Gln) amidotransferase subunit C
MSSPNITQDEVHRIARLARLAPSSDQAEVLAAELTRILEHFATLSEVDTSSVEATPTMVSAAVLRADELRPSLDRAEVLAAAPASREGGFSVPKVLEVET